MLAKPTVDLKLLRCEPKQHLLVSSAIGLRDERADLALTALKLAMLQGVECVLHLLGDGLLWRIGRGGIVGVLQCPGEEYSALLIGSGVERVGRSGGIGERFEDRRGGKILVPLRVVDKLLGGETARCIALR